jgi:hypothetical protein
MLQDSAHVPPELRSQVEALRDWVEGQGFRPMDLVDGHPLCELAVFRRSMEQGRDWRQDVVDGMDWLGGVTETFPLARPTDRLNKRERAVFQAFMGLGDFEGVSREGRKTGAMAVLDETQQDSHTNAQIVKHRKHMWDAFRKKDYPQMLARVCQIFLWEGDMPQQSKPTQFKIDISKTAPRGYYLREYEQTCNYPDEPGGVQTTLTNRTIVAVRPISEWRQPQKQYGHGELKASRQLFGPGRLYLEGLAEYTTRNAKLPGEAYEEVIDFGQTVEPGHPQSFATLDTVQVPWEQLVRDDFQDHRGLIPDLDIESMRVTVRFPASKLPREVWHYEGMYDWLVPGVPGDAEKLTLDESRTATWSWSNPTVGRAHGLAWLW